MNEDDRRDIFKEFCDCLETTEFSSEIIRKNEISLVKDIEKSLKLNTLEAFDYIICNVSAT